jgi:DNA-binding transcriptional LysR family regulator
MDSLIDGCLSRKRARASVYTHATNVRIRLAPTGRFLAVITPSLLKLSTNHMPIKILPVELPQTQRQIGIITLKNRTLSPLAQCFIECAREIAKLLVNGKL